MVTTIYDHVLLEEDRCCPVRAGCVFARKSECWEKAVPTARFLSAAVFEAHDCWLKSCAWCPCIDMILAPFMT